MTMTISIGRSVITRYPLLLRGLTYLRSTHVRIGSSSGNIARKFSSVQQIEKEVRTTLEVAVPTLLEQKKDAQLIPPWWGVVGSLSSSSSSPSPFVSINDKSIDDLATLNGYHRVPLEAHHCSVPLASGVLAQSTEKIDEQYAMFVRHNVINTTSKNDDNIRNEVKQRIGKHYEEFARRHNITSSNDNTTQNKNPQESHQQKKQYPPFIIEDYNIYRVLENYVEQYLNQQEERIRKWFQGHVEQSKASYNKTVNRMYKPISNLVKSESSEKSQVSLDDDNTSMKAGNDHDKLKTSSSLVLDKDDASTSLNEDLMIVAQDGQVLLFDDVPAQFRILVLPEIHEKEPPYRMKHGRAGTVIYSSLVFFGAVPAAYRSLKYALDYPGLAQVMVASVVGTISYSFWASRESAKSSQSMTVTRGAAARLIARDAAALSLLRDGATQALVEDVIDEYLGRLKGAQNKGYKEEEKDDKREREKEIETKQLHPLDIAIELGLLERGVDGESQDELVAIDWADARSQILHRATNSLLKQ